MNMLNQTVRILQTQIAVEKKKKETNQKSIELLEKDLEKYLKLLDE